MRDTSDKHWLRSAAYLAPDLRTAAASLLFWIGVAALVGGVLIWGMWVGHRDARLMQQADQARLAVEQQALIEACERDRGDGAGAYRNLRTGALLCVGPSNRLAPLPRPRGGSE